MTSVKPNGRLFDLYRDQCADGESSKRAPLVGSLSLDGQQIDFPVTEPTCGDRGLEVSQLRAKTGFVALDPGFTTTASCTSEITFIDGGLSLIHI